MKNKDMPAMPITMTQQLENASTKEHETYWNGLKGLTKREYIATQVIQGVLSSTLAGADGDMLIKNTINITDALLKALEDSDG